MSDPDDKPLLFRRSVRGVARARLLRFAQRLRDEVAGGKHFCCLLTDDAEMQKLNLAFLGHDYPTDVLSFPWSDRSDGLGELAISVNRARQQSAELGHSVDQEIEILMLHGLLHLLGMDHEADQGEMERAERHWQERLGLVTPLIARNAR